MLQRFFLLLIALLVLPDIYIFRTFIPYEELNILFKLLYWLPTILLFMGLIHFLYQPHKKADTAPQISNIFIGLFLFFSVSKAVFAFSSLTGNMFNYLFSWSTLVFEYTGGILGILTATFILYKRSGEQRDEADYSGT